VSKPEGKARSPVDEGQRARQLWARFEYHKRRGHTFYVEQAREAENFTLGAGRQWSEEEHNANDKKGKLSVELNHVLPAVTSAVGYQINNRMDIKLRPRGRGADEEKARVLQKVVMQVADNCGLHDLETDVFEDGAIQQRGFYQVSLDYSESVFGELKIYVLDPMDVIIDSDAKSYDPDDWADVRTLRHYTRDQVRQKYGEDVARKLDNLPPAEDDSDFGDDESDDLPRNKFGMDTMYSEHLEDHEKQARWQIIETQEWEWSAKTKVAIFPQGDVRIIESAPPEKLQEYAAQGAALTTRPMRRVRIAVSTREHVLFDEISPFPFIDIVPFFWFFRRGQTIGMVDNAISPQQVQNKAISQFIHIIATAAGSGWITEENSLSNMDAAELERRGGEAGLHIEVHAGKQFPKRIDPPPAPEGLKELVTSMPMFLQQITGVNAAMQGVTEGAESGIALQSRQHAAQQQLARPLANLARTRRMLAKRIVWIVQNYYDYPRIFRITEEDARGLPKNVELPVNQEMPDGTILNDLTIGEYDMKVDSVPTTVTFENGEFVQVMEMRKEGVPIPDSVVINASNMSRKAEVIEAMDAQAPKTDPLNEAKAVLAQAQAALAQAQAAKVEAEAVSKRVESLYSATTAAQLIAVNPAIAPVADQILGSAGFKDSNAAPVIGAPEQASLPVAMPPENTNPLTPPNPQVGALQGIEAGNPQ